MLNRRFLRVKALQSIYAYHQSESSNLPQAERQLLAGVDDLYKLFVYQLSFWVEIRQFAERRIEENKLKHFPTEEDLNPNMKFVDNRILKALDDNQHLAKLVDQYKIDWVDSREANISYERPSTLMSIWQAVRPSTVPVVLKSISPR